MKRSEIRDIASEIETHRKLRIAALHAGYDCWTITGVFEDQGINPAPRAVTSADRFGRSLRT